MIAILGIEIQIRIEFKRPEYYVEGIIFHKLHLIYNFLNIIRVDKL